MDEATPQDRAASAAEALAAEGNPVTARAVQQRARVSMTIAAAVARDWNSKQAEMQAVPDIPEAINARVQSLWREAVLAARAEHDTDREGWASKIRGITDERDGALEDADRERQRADELEAELASAADRIAGLETQLHRAQAEVAAAETRAAAAEGVAGGLREALAALKPDPEPAAKKK